MADHVDALRRSLAEVLTLDDLAGTPVADLQRAVGASQALLYAYDGAAVPQLLAGSLLAGVAAYTPAHYDEDPLHPHMRGLAPTLLLLPDEHVHARVHRSVAYADFYRRADAHHYLGLWPTARAYATAGMFGVFLTRSRRQGPFASDQVASLRVLEPELRAMARRVARVANLERDRALLAEPGPTSARGGLVAWELDGTLALASPGVEPALAAAGHDLGALWRVARAVARPRRHGGPVALERVLQGPEVDLRVACTLRVRGVAAPLVVAVLERVSHAARRAATLTPAERRVLDALAEGLKNRDIAARLFVSLDTVKTHVKRVLAKLEVTSRSEAALIGAQLTDSPPGPRTTLTQNHPFG